MIKYEKINDEKSCWTANPSLFHRCIPLHWHEYYEFELVVSGTGTQICNGVENILKKGSLTVISPQDFHCIETHGDEGLCFKTFCVREDLISSEIKSLLDRTPPPYILELSEHEYNLIYYDISYLETILDKHHPNRDYIIPRMVELILCKILEIVPHQANNQEQFKQYDKSLYNLQPIISYINSHYNETLCRNELAKMLHLSPSYLSNIFKKALGITLTDYITSRRMTNAKALLKYGNESVSNTMSMVGYNSPSLFYRHFYKYYGIKPSEILRKNNETMK